MVPRHGLISFALPSTWGWGHGLVLRRRLLGEEDLRLDVLFLRRGILEGMVRRGALPTTPWPGALAPPAITLFHFQWLSQERVRIRHWEESRLFPRAREQAPLVLEICHALTALLPRAWWDPALFRCALRALRRLETGDPPQEVALFFRLEALEALGHSPLLLLPQGVMEKVRQSQELAPPEKFVLSEVTGKIWRETLENHPKERRSPWESSQKGDQ